MGNTVRDIGLPQSRPDTIPVADPAADVGDCQGAILAAVDRVLRSGRYILGHEVEAFEREWADYLGVQHCIGVANGTDALALALKAVGIQAGDEVVTVSHTAVATVASIESIGAIPVFVDIDPLSRCMDPALLETVLTPHVRAFVPVHIYGQPADMGRILAVARRHHLSVIEDCAQAHGAEITGSKVGTFGDAAAFSFYPTKNLGAVGDAGAVVCSDTAIAERVRSLRQYGWRQRYISDMAGTNSRLDEVQAAILRVKLPHLAQRNRVRRAIAERYCKAITATGLVGPSSLPETVHAMHLFVVESMARDQLAEFLWEEGITTARHYPMPVHRQPAYVGRLRGRDRLPVTEKLYERLLTLPCHPELTDEQIERICARLHAWSETGPIERSLPVGSSSQGISL
jgi:dTDP-4-amino-4,6-dideoxygalactose transaminase